MAWEVEAALRKIKIGKEAVKDQVNIETLNAGDETIAKQLPKLYTKCMTERRTPNTLKEANIVIFFKKGGQKRHQELQANLFAIKYVQTVHTIIATRLEKKLDENQPTEQAGCRRKYSTTDHIHAFKPT